MGCGTNGYTPRNQTSCCSAADDDDDKATSQPASHHTISSLFDLIRPRQAHRRDLAIDAQSDSNTRPPRPSTTCHALQMLSRVESPYDPFALSVL
ncbi:hypothetical protein C8035_v002847 [Colletotrichum spinosum]|uniref:Uncharacterized protein n=1 Tax=Colletotrichum spinosum TaxID=1347390 RepID=A0A4R8PX84_9PEZI|nr:hypothetical protein C8035_v002847 [Colletotrichum spinosum]